MIILIFLTLMIGILFGIYYIRARARALSRQFFHTDSLLEGYQQQKRILSETPKSVSGMTRVYLPQIARDFPEFHYEEFKQRAEQMLLSAFQAISQENPSLLEYASSDLTQTVSLQIASNRNEGKREFYQQVSIHQTEITSYKKLAGTCTITLQSAVGHLYWAEQNETVVAGDRTLKEQCKYDIQITYIQDTSRLSGSAQTAFTSATCPSCGAPVEAIGDKVCAYCGSGIQTVNIRVWTINQFTKL